MEKVHNYKKYAFKNFANKGLFMFKFSIKVDFCEKMSAMCDKRNFRDIKNEGPLKSKMYASQASNLPFCKRKPIF